MKKNLFLLAAALFGLAACSNNDEIVEEPAVRGIPMTLTASIGSPSSTRTAYEWDGTNKILNVRYISTASFHLMMQLMFALTVFGQMAVLRRLITRAMKSDQAR